MDGMTAFEAIGRRTIGWNINTFYAQMYEKQHVRIKLNPSKSILQPSDYVATTALEFDHSSQRYFIIGTSRGHLALYDACNNDTTTTKTTTKIHPLYTWKCQNTIRPSSSKKRAHLGTCSTVAWYPYDTGLFISGGVDGTIVAWDTETGKRVLTFDLEFPITTVKFNGEIIAASTCDNALRICEVSTGIMTHRLAGHTGGGLQSLDWSPTQPFQVITGGASDGNIRIWDIRRSGQTAW